MLRSCKDGILMYGRGGQRRELWLMCGQMDQEHTERMKAVPGEECDNKSSRAHVGLELLGRRKCFEGEVECDFLNKRVVRDVRLLQMHLYPVHRFSVTGNMNACVTHPHTAPFGFNGNLKHIFTSRWTLSNT